MARVSRKNQITLPVDVLRQAGISAGDEVAVRVVGPGRLELERSTDLTARWAGALPAETYPPGYLRELRGEWEQ